MGERILKALPISPEETAFAAVVAILKSDPGLQRIGVQWQTWENDPTDLVEPTSNQLPYIQLTPQPGKSGWAEESMHHADLTISIGIVVAGTHRADILNLWHAVRLALWPRDPTRFNYVKSIMSPLVFNGELNNQPFALTVNDANTKMLSATGSLYLKLDVNTTKGS